MPNTPTYWTKKTLTRRDAVRGAAIAGGSVAALSLVGCGGSDDKAASENKPSEEIDWTKGKPGGVLHAQVNNYLSSLNLVEVAGSTSRFAGPTHSGLLNFKSGRSGLDPSSIDVEPDAAAALPEQPNDLTQIYKLRGDVKFHNGRLATAEDVKYSLDKYISDKSAYKDLYSWIDKVEATDTRTVSIKTKAPYADALPSIAIYQGPFILAKEHEESPAVNEKMMGTGPYIFASQQAPISVNYRRNPDYFLKPLPYFDEMVYHAIVDQASQIAQFISKNVQTTFQATPEVRDQMKQGRPDAKMWSFLKEGQCVWLRCDQAPYTDARVRQALSLTVDRKQLRDGVFHGEGEDDQAFSIAHKYWGFKKPSELKSAKNWVYNPTEGKRLLSAAGIDKPIEAPIAVSAGASNQQTIDQIVLVQSKWKELGVANIKDTQMMNAQFSVGPGVGNFEGMAAFNNSQQAVVGSFLYGVYWSPPEGVKVPTKNVGHVNDQAMSKLLEKQLTQFKIEERRTTFHEIEEIFGDNQYRLVFSASNNAWFGDPSLRNAEIFQYTNSACSWYYKYWWFDKA